MQFRNSKNLRCRIIRAIEDVEVEAKVEDFGEKVIFEDLQYSTTTRENGQVEYSVFIIYRTGE